MVFRYEERRRDEGRDVEVEGRLDAAAVEELMSRNGLGPADRLVLRAGTEITPDGLERLRAVRADVVAASPWLARWLAQAGIGRRSQ